MRDVEQGFRDAARHMQRGAVGRRKGAGSQGLDVLGGDDPCGVIDAADGVAPPAHDDLFNFVHGEFGERRRHADRMREDRLQNLEFRVEGEAAAEPLHQPGRIVRAHIALRVDVLDEHVARHLCDEVAKIGIGANSGPRDKRSARSALVGSPLL